MPLSATERFSDRADAYVRGRPTYPQAIIEQLQKVGALNQGHTVVDLGVGNGLSAEPFLRSGHTVIGVEPNASMRTTGDQQLREFTGYRSVAGTAEATTLPDDAADLVIAGQAFHWFDVARAAIEARRILRAGGWAALIWNDRQSTGSAFLAGYEALLRSIAISTRKRSHDSLRQRRRLSSRSTTRESSSAKICWRSPARHRICRHPAIRDTPRCCSR